MRPRDHLGDPGEHDESREVHMFTLGHVVHQGEYIHPCSIQGYRDQWDSVLVTSASMGC